MIKPILSKHQHSTEVTDRWEQICAAWAKLEDAVKNRRDTLNNSSVQLEKLRNLCIEFSRLASAFNSWYENVEENLTDPGA